MNKIDINGNIMIGPEEFKGIMNMVFSIIPSSNRMYIVSLVKKARKEVECSAGNIKSAILALKADGKIELDNDGYIWRIE